MCGICGCGSEENGVIIQNPREIKIHQHEHHTHEHHHDAHSHEHHHGHSHDHSHTKTIEVEKDILQQNDLMAARNRGYFEAKNIFTINLVSSPGSGKTSILERTLTDLKNVSIRECIMAHLCWV